VTSLHQDEWRSRDLLAFTLLVAAGLFLIYALAAELNACFSYSIYPRLGPPEVSVIGLGLSLIPGIPILFKRHD
jgi:hypothetical protein